MPTNEPPSGKSRVKTHVAIQGVCAWPNLVQLPDGTIVATIFNQPTHGGWEGDLDCWASTDGGQLWTVRGRPAPHEPATNRMNCSAGLARDGSLIVMASGWSRRQPVGIYTSPNEGQVLPLWVCRSSDGAQTWRHAAEAVLSPPKPALARIPFGTIVHNHDGTLGVSLYGEDWENPKLSDSYLYVSRDDGQTWELRSTIATDCNETTLLALASGRLLAAVRTASNPHLELFASTDAGVTWRARGPLSLPHQFPAHLLGLADGRVALCYGNRCANNCGIDARISRNGGDTWGPPIRLANLPFSDGGYPASVQLADGTIVTAYYRQISGRYHYEMCVATWDIDAFDPPGYRDRHIMLYDTPM